MRLWDLWYGVLHAAKRIPWTDAARQRKLAALVEAFRARPDPPLPVPLPVPLRRDWVWERGTLWSELVMLGPSACEAWNDACGCGAGWTAPEQRAWTNVNAFVARLVAMSGTGSAKSPLVLFAKNYGAAAISTALEQEIRLRQQHHPAPLPTQLALLLTVAAAWVAVAGERMFALRCDDESRRMRRSRGGRGGMPCLGMGTITRCRINRRFVQRAGSSGAGGSTRRHTTRSCPER